MHAKGRPLAVDWPKRLVHGAIALNVLFVIAIIIVLTISKRDRAKTVAEPAVTWLDGSSTKNHYAVPGTGTVVIPPMADAHPIQGDGWRLGIKFSLSIGIGNVSREKTVTVKSWNYFGTCKLRDDLGNEYRVVRFEGPNAELLQFDTATLMPWNDVPGESNAGTLASDLLIFHRLPPSGAKHFFLELSGENVGGTETIRFKFPATIINRM